MAWIKTIDEGDARGVLETYYKKFGDCSEGVDEILKIHSLNPDSLRHHYEMYKQLMAGPSGLSRMQREMIAVVVSKINACHY
jgi:alkylhydroperoxidase family enzyme